MVDATKTDSDFPQPREFDGLGWWIGIPLLRFFFATVFTLCGPYRIRGANRVPKKGPVLILANHRADVDPPFVQLGCPRGIHFMGKSELFDMPVLGWVLRTLEVFPVKRGEADRPALKHAAELLKAGAAVGVFPEGQLTEDGKLQSIKAGVALILRLAPGVPVICFGLKSTEKVLPYGKLIPRPAFRWIEGNWGEPRTFEPKASAEEITQWIEQEFRRLTDEPAPPAQ